MMKISMKKTIYPKLCLFVLGIVGLTIVTSQAYAEDAEGLAKKLANPVASLISVPVDIDYDSDIGPEDEGERITVVAKPVIPFSLNENWNLITRTIIPYVDIEDLYPGFGSESGLSDIQMSLFLSPAKAKNGVIWGAGPILLLPTASEDILGTEKWGAGPTGVVLKQAGPLTYGMLVNHVWSYAGDDDRDDVSSSFVQPFFSYTTKTATSFTLQTESTYNWETEEWSVPVNAIAAQVFRIGPQLIQLKAGVRYWADSPDSGPEGWGFKGAFVLLFPK
jgi:hypothetical protein